MTAGYPARYRRELPPGHVLDGHDLHPIARCTRCDDILLRVDERQYAIVHLTWRQRPEPHTDWPSTDLHTNPAALLADPAERHRPAGG